MLVFVVIEEEHQRTRGPESRARKELQGCEELLPRLQASEESPTIFTSVIALKEEKAPPGSVYTCRYLLHASSEGVRDRRHFVPPLREISRCKLTERRTRQIESTNTCEHHALSAWGRDHAW